MALPLAKAPAVEGKMRVPLKIENWHGGTVGVFAMVVVYFLLTVERFTGSRFACWQRLFVTAVVLILSTFSLPCVSPLLFDIGDVIFVNGGRFVDHSISSLTMLSCCCGFSVDCGGNSHFAQRHRSSESYFCRNGLTVERYSEKNRSPLSAGNSSTFRKGL